MRAGRFRQPDVVHTDPYSPPRASVMRHAARVARPGHVNAAAALLVASIVLGIGSHLSIFNESTEVAFFVLAVVIVTCAVGAVAIRSRRNWARWLVIVLIGIGLVSLPWTLAEMDNTYDKVIYSLQAVLQAGVVVLMLLPPARAWYEMKASAEFGPP